MEGKVVKVVLDHKNEEKENGDDSGYGYDLPFGRRLQKKFLKEYIDVDFMGETMRLEKYKWVHNLKWYDEIPPLNYPVKEVTDEPVSPFNINYTWVKKIQIQN